MSWNGPSLHATVPAALTNFWVHRAGTSTAALSRALRHHIPFWRRPDAVGRQLQRHGLGQSRQRRLGGAIDRRGLLAAEGADRRDVDDDAAGALRGHLLGRGDRAVDGALE